MIFLLAKEMPPKVCSCLRSWYQVIKLKYQNAPVTTKFFIKNILVIHVIHTYSYSVAIKLSLKGMLPC